MGQEDLVGVLDPVDQEDLDLGLDLVGGLDPVGLDLDLVGGLDLVGLVGDLDPEALVSFREVASLVALLMAYAT